MSITERKDGFDNLGFSGGDAYESLFIIRKLMREFKPSGDIVILDGEKFVKIKRLTL